MTGSEGRESNRANVDVGGRDELETARKKERCG